VLGIGGSKRHLRVMKRPEHLDPPAYLSPSPPVPETVIVAELAHEAKPPAGESDRLDPTRYGDWEKKGIAVDF
jgi:hypothetical protein